MAYRRRYKRRLARPPVIPKGGGRMFSGPGGNRLYRGLPTYVQARIGKMQTLRGGGYPQGGLLFGRNPFKERMFVKHDYCDLLTFTSGVGGIFGTEEVFRLGSLFDPDFTAVGHQPYGRDTMATIYNRYEVFAVKIDLVWTDPSADGLAVGMLLEAPSDTTTVTGMTVQQLGEKQGSMVKFCNNTGSQVVRTAGYFRLSRLSGLTPLQWKADFSNFSAAAGSNPTISPWLRFAAADTSGAGGLTIKCLVRVRFYAKWYDRQTLPIS